MNWLKEQRDVRKQRMVTGRLLRTVLYH